MVLLIFIEGSFLRLKCALALVWVCVCPSSLRTDKALFGSEGFFSTQHCDLNMLLAEVLTGMNIQGWLQEVIKKREIVNNQVPNL